MNPIVQTNNLLWGKTVAERPDADKVKIGTVFAIADGTLQAWISNGEEWSEIDE